MKEIIEITDSNYKDYCNIDIAAFSLAQGGAMGEPGGIVIIDTGGNVYHTNYCRNNVICEHLDEIIPILKECKFGIFSHTVPEGWHPEDLGFGNHLTIKGIYKDTFCKEWEERQSNTENILFQEWSGVMMMVLGKEDITLTMSKIWNMMEEN